MRIATLCLVAIAVVACRPPDPPRAGTLLRDQTFEHDGKQRRYHFYIPPDVDTPRPLVLSLHGGGGEIDDHIGLDAARWPHQVWLDLADEEDLFILVPSGIDKHWNDCRPECVRCGQEDDLGFILALMDEVQAEHNIDVERVFSTGESNGGFMTQSLAQVAPERFAAVGEARACERGARSAAQANFAGRARGCEACCRAMLPLPLPLSAGSGRESL